MQAKIGQSTLFKAINTLKQKYQHVSYVPVKSKLKHPPPFPGIPWAFDVFCCPGGREFDELSLPGAGHLITTLAGWGI